jgi:hypothetical protein
MSKTHLRSKAHTATPATKPEEPEIKVAVATPISDVAKVEDETINLVVGPLIVEEDEEATSEEDLDLSALEDDESVKQEEDEDEDTVLVPAKPVKAQADEEEHGFLQIHNENCLICKSLIPSMTKTFRSCHFSKGNQACPARLVQIVIRIPLEEIIPRWLAAEREGDYKRIAKMAAHLSTKPEWYQLRVKDELQSARDHQK